MSLQLGLRTSSTGALCNCVYYVSLSLPLFNTALVISFPLSIMSQSSTHILKKSSVFVLIVLHVMIIPSLGEPEGANVCEKMEEITVTITKQVSIPYQVKTTSVCLTPPFRCTKMKTAYKIESRDEPVRLNRTVKVCCEGYYESENSCIPINSPGHTSETLISHPNARLDESSSFASANIWIAISLTSLLVIAVFMLLLFRYKKKIHSLREEVNYVTYTVERGSSCGSSAHYAAPSEVTCSDNNVTPQAKCNNLVSVVNQLKSDPSKISNIEKAAALKKAIELEHDHPFACSSSVLSVPSSSSASCSSSSSAKLAAIKSPSASSAKQLFKPTANPNVYQCQEPSTEQDSMEPIYEELPDTPVPDDRSSHSPLPSSVNNSIHNSMPSSTSNNDERQNQATSSPCDEPDQDIV